MNYALHIISIFVLYLLFPVGFLLIKNRLKRGGNLMPVVVVPILFSFFIGAGILLYAVAAI
jgi:hypothetical protein